MRKHLMGIEIGNYYIKIVAAKKRGVKWEITHVAKLRTPDSCISDGRLIEIEKVAQVIKTYLKNAKIKTKNLYLLMNSTEIIAREIEVGGPNHKYLKDLLSYKIEDYLPIDAKAYELDFQILEEVEQEEKKAVKLLAVAAPKDLVQEYIQLGELLEAKIKGLSIQVANIGKLFRKLPDEGDEGKEGDLPILMLDIGKEMTNLTIVKGQMTRFTQRVEFGAKEINHKILEIFEEDDLEEVEDFKQKYAAIYEEEHLLDVDFYGHYISQIIKEDISQKLIQAIKKCIKFYELNNSEEKIKKIYLLGGGGEVKNLDNYIEKVMEIEVERLTQTDYFINGEEYEKEIPYIANLLGLVRNA